MLGKPCRRASYRAAICGRERIGKAASIGEAWRNVAVERSVTAKFVADASLRIEDKNGNYDVVANSPHYRCEIGISRDEDMAVGASFIRITEHSVCNVHIRHLLRDAKYLYATIVPSPITGSTWFIDRREEFGLFAVTALNDFNEWAICKRIEILPLSLGMALVMGFVDYTRREVLDGNDGMVGIEKFGGKHFKVKPFVGGTTELSIVEVAGIDVDDRVFHVFPQKCKSRARARLCAASPKVGGLNAPSLGASGSLAKS